LWRYAFQSPIVHAWRLVNGKLVKVNLFNTSHIPRRNLAAADGDDESAAAMPLLYIGTYNNQLYIQVVSFLHSLLLKVVFYVSFLLIAEF
jgi:hypothetical protein